MHGVLPLCIFFCCFVLKFLNLIHEIHCQINRLPAGTLQIILKPTPKLNSCMFVTRRLAAL
jgi:hypothetical protein